MVAIIAVLVAISIPIFTSQLEKAREATDAANIRSQYAEVMAEAITDGGHVKGNNMFGAVELKQKKNEWQSTGLKENLQGVYQRIEGDYPKAGGTAWVEYKDDQVILHYEGGSESTGGGSTGGSTGESAGGSTGESAGGSTGGSVGGSTGGSSAGGSTGGGNIGDSTGEGNTGGGNIGDGEIIDEGSDTNTDPEFAYKNVNEKSDEWPIVGKTVDVKTGEVISYNGKLYISATTRSWEMNQYWYTTPDNQSGDFYAINNKPAQTDADLKKPWQGSDETALVNLSIGDLYQDLDNNYYVYRGGSSTNTPPSRNSNDWIRVLIK